MKQNIKTSVTGEGNAPRDVRDIESSPYCDPCETGADEREAIALNAPRHAIKMMPRIGVSTEEFNRMFAKSIRDSGGLLVAKQTATGAFRFKLAKEVKKYTT